MSPYVQQLIVNFATEIINPIIYLLVAVGIIYFIWGLVTFIANSDNEEKRREGQKHMLYGIIGLVIMLGALGIISLVEATVQGTFGP